MADEQTLREEVLEAWKARRAARKTRRGAAIYMGGQAALGETPTGPPGYERPLTKRERTAQRMSINELLLQADQLSKSIGSGSDQAFTNFTNFLGNLIKYYTAESMRAGTLTEAGAQMRLEGSKAVLTQREEDARLRGWARVAGDYKTENVEQIKADFPIGGWGVRTDPDTKTSTVTLDEPGYTKLREYVSTLTLQDAAAGTATTGAFLQTLEEISRSVSPTGVGYSLKEDLFDGNNIRMEGTIGTGWRELYQNIQQIEPRVKAAKKIDDDLVAATTDLALASNGLSATSADTQTIKAFQDLMSVYVGYMAQKGIPIPEEVYTTFPGAAAASERMTGATPEQLSQELGGVAGVAATDLQKLLENMINPPNPDWVQRREALLNDPGFKTLLAEQYPNLSPDKALNAISRKVNREEMAKHVRGRFDQLLARGDDPTEPRWRKRQARDVTQDSVLAQPRGTPGASVFTQGAEAEGAPGVVDGALITEGDAKQMTVADTMQTVFDPIAKENVEVPRQDPWIDPADPSRMLSAEETRQNIAAIEDPTTRDAARQKYMDLLTKGPEPLPGKTIEQELGEAPDLTTLRQAERGGIDPRFRDREIEGMGMTAQERVNQLTSYGDLEPDPVRRRLRDRIGSNYRARQEQERRDALGLTEFEEKGEALPDIVDPTGPRPGRRTPEDMGSTAGDISAFNRLNEIAENWQLLDYIPEGDIDMASLGKTPVEAAKNLLRAAEQHSNWAPQGRERLDAPAIQAEYQKVAQAAATRPEFRGKAFTPDRADYGAEPAAEPSAVYPREPADEYASDFDPDPIADVKAMDAAEKERAAIIERRLHSPGAKYSTGEPVLSLERRARRASYRGAGLGGETLRQRRWREGPGWTPGEPPSVEGPRQPGEHLSRKRREQQRLADQAALIALTGE